MIKSLPTLTAVLSAITLSLACPIVRADGIYESVELKGKESHDLIETADEYFDQFERRSVLHNDLAMLNWVRNIGHALAPPETDDYFQYEFYLIRDPSPNAFAMPNGKIFIHTGMLARLEDSSQLAALLAHEINHVAGHHSVVQYRIGAGQWLDIIFTGGLISLFSELKFSRELEQEADDLAPQLVLNSQYDPRAFPEVMEILHDDFEGLQPRIATIWTTHPDPEKRIETSRAIVAELPAKPRDEAQFDALMHPLRLMTVEDYIRDDYPYTAIAVSSTFLDRYPNDLDLMMLLGNAWQTLGPRAEFAADDFSNRDKRRNLRRRMRRTRVERNDRLLETPEGQAAFKLNLETAHDVYEEILAFDENYAAAHRGLGEVYELLDMPREAARKYLQYVRADEDAEDRTVVIGRLAALRDRLATEEESQ